MEAPQIIMIVLYSLALFNGLINHGKLKTGRESFFTNLVAIALECGILYWGGFWG